MTNVGFDEIKQEDLQLINGGGDPYAIVGGIIGIAGGIAKKNPYTVAAGVVAIAKGTDFVPSYMKAIEKIDGPVYVIGP
ncbi:MAG TPA: hypothetical protein VIO64_07085 [Pseudobacteroides sp.]|uniref:hypothetical protein n=1 Tax=Pseudobacteroides sp. TaxID=1968840 RepID=UPI002F95A87C